MIKVYTGPMFSGKSTNLLIDYNMIQDKDSILCFKPSKDTRDLTKLRARNVDQKVEAIVIQKFGDIEKYVTKNTKYIFIDEVQFIIGNFNILTKLSLNGIDIIIAGLNQTSEQHPFGTMPYILSLADEIIVLKAKCHECGHEAAYTYCTVKKTGTILVGNGEYKALCNKCLLKMRRAK